MREFSEESRQHFYDIIDEVNDSQWFDITDWLGDRLSDIASLFGYLDVDNYLDDMETYWTRVVDNNNTEKSEIDGIFEAVQGVDEDYESKFSQYIETVTEQFNLVKYLGEIVKPEQGKFTTYLISQAGVGDYAVKEPDWLNSVMSLEGSTPQEEYLNRRLSQLKLPWNQEKVDALWEACAQIYYNYGIEVDPRFLLAVIIQEGTGSFNTSSTNLAADGQNGVEENFSVDLMKANALIFGKILGYMYYGNEFREAVANYSSSFQSEAGDVFDYINWNTPIINVNDGKLRTGCYAGHSAWGEGVESIYENLTYEGAGEEYSKYLMGVDDELLEQILPECEYVDYTFSAVQNGQNSKGELDGTWTIVAQ